MRDEHKLMAQVTLWVHVPEDLISDPNEHYFGIESEEVRKGIENKIEDIVVGGIEDQVKVTHVEVDIQPVHNP